MENKLLKINNLKTTVEEKEILKGLNLEIGKGEIHVIMGPNGAGKSTLANTLMGHPKYSITDGKIIFDGEEINDFKVDVRAKRVFFYHFNIQKKCPESR